MCVGRPIASVVRRGDKLGRVPTVGRGGETGVREWPVPRGLGLRGVWVSGRSTRSDAGVLTKDPEVHDGNLLGGDGSRQSPRTLREGRRCGTE